MRDESYEALMEYALKLCLKRRLTCHETELRLRKKKIGVESDALRVIERLKELSYLDDDLYAEDFIKERLKFRPRGIAALKNDMYKRGLPKSLIENAVSAAGIDEEAVAREVAMRKTAYLKRFPLAKQKQKLMLFLKSRGFAAGVIYKIVDEIRA